MAAMTANRAAPPLRHLAIRRAIAALLLVLIAAGCMLLCVGVPAGGMWLAGELTDTFTLHLPLALALVIPGMVGTAVLLGWLNHLYLRVTGGEIAGNGRFQVRRRGPLEPLLLLSLLLAIIALFVWFFFFAENPSRGVFG